MSHHMNQPLLNLFVVVDNIRTISYAFFIDLIFFRKRILKISITFNKRFRRYSRWYIQNIYSLQNRTTHESIANWPISWVSWVTLFYITEFWILTCSPVADCLVLQVTSRVALSSCSSWISKPNPNTLKAYKIHRN